MLVAAAVCPHPPLLIAELAAGAAGELDELRADCSAALERVWAAEPDVLYVVGADVGTRATTFAPWGVDVAVAVPEPLPLPLLVGARLAAPRLGGERLASFVVVDPDLPPRDCAELGAELAASAAAVALLVMGDGSACHSEKAPGYLDPRASAYDDSVTASLRAGDHEALLALDPVLSADLMVAGRAPWQVLAGAAGAARANAGPPTVAGARFAAPYGVGYHVVTWRWQGSA